VSGGTAIPWDAANNAALSLVGLLEAGCVRIAIAGSLRRRKAEVHDIEIVAIPRRGPGPIVDLWGTAPEVDWLEDRIASLLDIGVVSVRAVEVRRSDGSVESSRRMGPLYKALEYGGLPVDLFITDAERWGCIFALRTGPGDWNTRLVTDCKRWFRSVADGRVLHLGRPIPTPEEADFFRALGVPWIDPWERSVGSLRFDPDLLAL
jgi:DNA polymerase/3'-5' exonuclease PolX